MARTAAAPRLSRQLSRRKGIWRLLFLVVIIVIVASYVSPVRSYIDRIQGIDTERAATDQLRQQRDALQQEQRRLQEDSYVEQVARRDLGLVKPGEQPYVVKDLNQDDAQTAQEPQQSRDRSLPGRIWDAVSSVLP